MKNQIVSNEYELTDNDMKQAEKFLQAVKQAEKLEQKRLVMAKNLAIIIYKPRYKLN